MPTWSDPPDFTSGAILTATQCNQLSDCIEFLHGLITGVNVPFRSIGIGTDVDQGDEVLIIRHLGRYLHYKVTMDSGEHDELRLYYNDDEIYADNGHQVSPYTWSGSIDLYDTGILAVTPTVGEFYEITFRWRWQEGETGAARIEYLLESDQDTL